MKSIRKCAGALFVVVLCQCAQAGDWVCTKTVRVYVPGKQYHVGEIQPGRVLKTAKLDDTRQWLIVNSNGKEYSMDARNFEPAAAIAARQQKAGAEIKALTEKISRINTRLGQLKRKKEEAAIAMSRGPLHGTASGFTMDGTYVELPVSIDSSQDGWTPGNKDTLEKWRLKKQLKQLTAKLRGIKKQ